MQKPDNKWIKGATGWMVAVERCPVAIFPSKNQATNLGDSLVRQGKKNVAIAHIEMNYKILEYFGVSHNLQS